MKVTRAIALSLIDKVSTLVSNKNYLGGATVLDAPLSQVIEAVTTELFSPDLSLEAAAAEQNLPKEAHEMKETEVVSTSLQTTQPLGGEKQEMPTTEPKSENQTDPIAVEAQPEPSTEETFPATS